MTAAGLRVAPSERTIVDDMKRSLVALALLCSSACAEEETPTILEPGARGACGSVVEGVVPAQVECPTDCPIAVEAFRVRDTSTCERSAAKYVACVGVAGGEGTPGAGVLDTPDGSLFVDSPAFDCSDGAEGCVTIDTAVRGRWSTCAEDEVAGCECACSGGECAYDRFVSTLDGCGLPSSCDPLTGDAEPSEAQIQCYLDVLAQGGPLRIELDTTTRNDITGQLVPSREILYINDFDVIRMESVAYDAPVVRCELQTAGFFLQCDPEDPTTINVENEEGNIERVPCTNPLTWVSNCEADDPECPGG